MGIVCGGVSETLAVVFVRWTVHREQQLGIKALPAEHM